MARLRVISDNDYAGDPDGLFQLAHLLLSPSVEVRAVIGSHLRPGDPFDPSDATATHAREAAGTVVGLLGLTGRVSGRRGLEPPAARPRDPGAVRGRARHRRGGDARRPAPAVRRLRRRADGARERVPARAADRRAADRRVDRRAGAPRDRARTAAPRGAGPVRVQPAHRHRGGAGRVRRRHPAVAGARATPTGRC